MKKCNGFQRANWTLVVLAFLISGIGFMFNQAIYSNELGQNQVVMKGWDLANLVVFLPLLIVGVKKVAKGKFMSIITLFGLLLFGFYNYLYYGFGMKFNQLFLLYTAALGMNFFLLLFIAFRCNQYKWDALIDDRRNLKPVSVFLIAVCLIFYMLWISDALISIFNNTAPRYVIDLGYSTSIVHLIDMVFILPLFIISAYFLRLKRVVGFAMGYASIIFLILLSIFMVIGAVYEKVIGFDLDLETLVIFPIIGSSSFYFLTRLQKAVVKS